MITWMQRHKKYLVVTIWVSVIAFVGAGFVGWGAYDFNSSRSSAVAKVGEVKIPIREFQMTYGNHYAYYNSLFGGELTQEKANELGLEKIVLESMVNEALLLNYAADLGLSVLNSELKDALSQDETFHNESGIFDKNLYYQTLRSANLDSKTYESHLRKQILLDKLNSVLHITPNEEEEKIIASALLMQDRLSVRVLTINPNEVTMNEDDLKAFWEKQKSKYLTPKTYTIKSKQVLKDSSLEFDESDLKAFWEEREFDFRHEDGKVKSFEEAKDDALEAFFLEQARKEALQVYLGYKKGEVVVEDSQTVEAKNLPIDEEELMQAHVGDILKPIEIEDGYIIVELLSINDPEPMGFDEAKALARVDYEKEIINKTLEDRAKAQLTLFQGRDIGFVGRDSTVEIENLSSDEVAHFIAYVFDNNDKRGYVLLDEKAVLYEIMEQKLLDKTKLERYSDMIKESSKQLKSTEIDDSLLNALRKRYSIKYFYKGN